MLLRRYFVLMRRVVPFVDARCDDIRTLVQLAPAHLQATGWLLFEHGWQQADAVAQLLREQGFEQVQSWRDLGGQLRVTGGQWRG